MAEDPLQNLGETPTAEDAIRRLLGLLRRSGSGGLNETTKIEGKSNLIDAGDKKGIWAMARDIAAMANAPGGDGHILYGVEQKPGDRKHNPQRKPLDSADIANVLREQCYPAPTFYYREETVDGELYGWLHAPKSGSQPHCWKENDGQWSVLTRHGASTVRANREELDEMYRATVGAIQNLLAELGSERLPGATSPADRMRVNNWWLPKNLQDYRQISWAGAVLAPAERISPLLDTNKLSDERLQQRLLDLTSEVDSDMPSAKLFAPGGIDKTVGEHYVGISQRRQDDSPLAQLRVYDDGLISYGRQIENEHGEGWIRTATLGRVPLAVLEYAARFLAEYDERGTIGAYLLQMAVHLSPEHKTLLDGSRYPIPELPKPVIVPSTEPREVSRGDLTRAEEIASQLADLFARIVRTAGS